VVSFISKFFTLNTLLFSEVTAIWLIVWDLVTYTTNLGIRHGGPMEWPLRSPDLTSMDFFLWVLWRTLSMYYHCRQHYMSSRHGSDRPVQTVIRKFSTMCDRRLNISLMPLKPLVVLTQTFINDKLLFIKLFQLVFQLVCFVSVTYRNSWVIKNQNHKNHLQTPCIHSSEKLPIIFSLQRVLLHSLKTFPSLAVLSCTEYYICPMTNSTSLD
jgi:hypothetical protein